jgi:hypothetical protein
MNAKLIHSFQDRSGIHLWLSIADVEVASFATHPADELVALHRPKSNSERQVSMSNTIDYFLTCKLRLLITIYEK